MVRSILMLSILSAKKLNERMECASSCYTHLSNIVSEHEVSSDGDVGRRLTRGSHRISCGGQCRLVRYQKEESNCARMIRHIAVATESLPPKLLLVISGPSPNTQTGVEGTSRVFKV